MCHHRELKATRAFARLAITTYWSAKESAEIRDNPRSGSAACERGGGDRVGRRGAVGVREVSTMRHASIIASDVNSSPLRAKKGIFALFIEALYHSRHFRAERTLRRYRDVISLAQSAILRQLTLRSESQKDVGE